MATKNNKVSSSVLEDVIGLNKIQYFIRFSPKHAEHVWDNYSDKNHRIKHREIQSMLKGQSVFVEKDNSSFFLSRHKGKVYITYVRLRGRNIDVITSYKCSNTGYLLIFGNQNLSGMATTKKQKEYVDPILFEEGIFKNRREHDDFAKSVYKQFLKKGKSVGSNRKEESKN